MTQIILHNIVCRNNGGAGVRIEDNGKLDIQIANLQAEGNGKGGLVIEQAPAPAPKHWLANQGASIATGVAAGAVVEGLKKTFGVP